MTKSYASLAFRKTMHCYFLNYVHCTKYREKGQNYCCTRVDPVFKKNQNSKSSDHPNKFFTTKLAQKPI